MWCLKGRITLHLIFIATLLPWATSRKINTTIYDANLAHVTYAPEDYCSRWVRNWVFWHTCEAWMKPWKTEVYRGQGKLATVHRSIDHRHSSVTIDFQGSAIWIYGPPRSHLDAIPGDYKICLHENHRLSYNSACYRVNVTGAYSATEDLDSPVVIFARGGLQHHEHRVVISVADPTDDYDTQNYQGIQFSHAVYTIERPTPWPIKEDGWRFREMVIHDTHPLLSYSSEEGSWSLWPWSTSGWAAKTYKGKDGSTVSWHELRSWGEQARNQWGVDTTITAGAIALYGIPKAHITSINDLSQICVRIDSGLCEVVDVQTAYLNAEDPHESVMIWRSDALDPSSNTRVSIRLVPTSSGSSVFPFEAIHYYEQKEYSSPYPPFGQLRNVTIDHDNSAVAYQPKRRCTWGCLGSFDPWTRKVGGPSSNAVSYRSTLAEYRKTEDPFITLDFRGSAVYVYGAPKSFIKAPYAPQHVCLDGVCRVVDIQQAYLNAPLDDYESVGTYAPRSYGLNSYEDNGAVSASYEATTMSPLHPELEPVLIWSLTGLDEKVQHRLRLALASLPSADDAEMTFVKVVYTNVSYEWGRERPGIPGYEPDHAYEGPLHPPHATKWAPGVPQNPPYSLPEPPRQRPPNDPPNSVIICLVALLIFTVFRISNIFSRRSGPEMQPIVPPPQYGPPDSRNIADAVPSYSSTAFTQGNYGKQTSSGGSGGR